MGIGLVIIMTPERSYADKEYDITTTTNQLPAQSNTVDGDNNRLQNCGQTAAGEHNGQSLECKQNNINEANEDARGMAILTVIKEVRCGVPITPLQNDLGIDNKNGMFSNANIDNMSANQIVPPFPIPCLSPSDFTIHVDGKNPSPSSFAGSAIGTTVIMGQGEYSVTETVPILPDGTENRRHLSSDCSGIISLGESKTCIITNEILRPFSPF